MPERVICQTREPPSSPSFSYINNSIVQSLCKRTHLNYNYKVNKFYLKGPRTNKNQVFVKESAIPIPNEMMKVKSIIMICLNLSYEPSIHLFIYLNIRSSSSSSSSGSSIHINYMPVVSTRRNWNVLCTPKPILLK